MRTEVDHLFDKVRSFYNEWDLKAMLVLSMSLQVLLLILGGRRKFTHKLIVRGFVWFSYISADSVGVMALGIISSQLGDMNGGTMDDDKGRAILSLWAPCLLLLLGGPDTITAYSLEDNELWLRHLLGLVVQTVATGYIFLLSWTASYLSLVSILMFGAALIKYGERSWVLWITSREKLTESMLVAADSGANYPRFMDEYALKVSEGYHVTADEVFEKLENDVSGVVAVAAANVPDADELVKAHFLFQIFKRVFLDLVLGFDDRDASKAIVDGMALDKITKIIEIELGFMYDILHTKAPILYSRWGLRRRFITSTIPCIVLVLFCSSSLYDNYPRPVDLALTVVVLAVIIFIEMYSLILLATSDWASVWLSKKDGAASLRIQKALSCLLNLCKQPRWSNSVGQLNLLSLCIQEKPMPCQRILKWMNLHDTLYPFFCTDHITITPVTKRQVFELDTTWKSYLNHGDVLQYILYAEGQNYSEGVHDRDMLQRAAYELEFDEAILVWHVATQLCLDSYPDSHIPRVKDNIETSKLLSRYMFYLLMRYPFMLPSGIGQIRIQDTLADAQNFFEVKGLYSTGISRQKEKSTTTCGNFLSNTKEDSRRQPDLYKEASQMLLHQARTKELKPPTKDKASVLCDGCRLACALMDMMIDMGARERMWKLISRSWLALLHHAAIQSSGDSHALQLRRGGELITHLWMLYAHLGLTEHFRMSEGHAIARLLLN